MFAFSAWRTDVRRYSNRGKTVSRRARRHHPHREGRWQGGGKGELWLRLGRPYGRQEGLVGRRCRQSVCNRQNRPAGAGEESHRAEVQEDQSVQDSTRPPAKLHGRAGQRYQAVIVQLAPASARQFFSKRNTSWQVRKAAAPLQTAAIHTGRGWASSASADSLLTPARSWCASAAPSIRRGKTSGGARTTRSSRWSPATSSFWTGAATAASSASSRL